MYYAPTPLVRSRIDLADPTCPCPDRLTLRAAGIQADATGGIAWFLAGALATALTIRILR